LRHSDDGARRPWSNSGRSAERTGCAARRPSDTARAAAVARSPQVRNFLLTLWRANVRRLLRMEEATKAVAGQYARRGRQPDGRGARGTLRASRHCSPHAGTHAARGRRAAARQRHARVRRPGPAPPHHPPAAPPAFPLSTWASPASPALLHPTPARHAAVAWAFLHTYGYINYGLVTRRAPDQEFGETVLVIGAGLSGQARSAAGAPSLQRPIAEQRSLNSSDARLCAQHRLLCRHLRPPLHTAPRHAASRHEARASAALALRFALSGERDGPAPPPLCLSGCCPAPIRPGGGLAAARAGLPRDGLGGARPAGRPRAH
jgi:hypothetical protein